MLSANGLGVVQERQERLCRGESFYAGKGITSKGRGRWHGRVDLMAAVTWFSVCYVSLNVKFTNIDMTSPASLPNPEMPSRLDPQSRAAGTSIALDEPPGKAQTAITPRLSNRPANKPQDDGGEQVETLEEMARCPSPNYTSPSCPVSSAPSR